ncbi:MAG: N-acetylmuramoyl-L-alanine amidase family protein [Defluviitaleaceae bacterium]|nr:N-acetylmuramoyl-L-alanine amidase family protein [Defluviitaleaceae bacterium]
MKIFLGIFLTLLLFAPATMYAEPVRVRLIIDGYEIIDLPSPPILVEGRTLVPFREVFQRVGGTVGWHGGHRQVSLFFGDNVLVMTIDETTANLNGNFIEMDTPPIIYNDRTMIPLRFPAEIFDFDVDWDDIQRAAIVNSPNASEGESSGIPIIPLPPVTGNENASENEESDKVELPWTGEQNDLPPPNAVLAETGGLARDVSTSVIQTIAHPQTTITALQTPLETGVAAYVAVASSPITGVSYFVLPDNRLVVDINNAVSLIAGEFNEISNVPVSGVRASQFSQEPRVTRIVFDVIGAAEFSITLSADRQLLTVSFSRNRITGVFGQSDAFSDSLFIQGEVLPAINISTEGFPHFFTINIDNATMDAASGLFATGVFASHFTVGGRTDGSSYVRVYVHGDWPSFSTAHSANSVAFMMHRGISGVRYDSVERELRISRDFAMDISEVRHINDYLRYRYTFVLPPSAEVLGRGEISILDGFVNYVSISRNAENHNIYLTLYTTRILSFSMHEEPDYFIIRTHLPRDVSPFIVVIDPGHGGTCPGTIHNNIVEKDLVLDVSLMVAQLLEADPFITVYMTRRTDTYVPLLRRAEFANELGADLFISIHANAAEIRRGVINPYPNGVETWYTISELEEAGNFVLNSREYAQIIQRHAVLNTGARDRGLREEPNFVVLRETNMPSVLLELGFITNPEEAARLANTQYRWLLAEAIYRGLVEAFATHPPSRSM